MELDNWVRFAATFAAVTLIPGPAMLLALTDGINGGPRKALGGILGVMAAGMIWAVVSLTGLAIVLRGGTALFRALRIAGAAYLVWMGLRTLVAAFRQGARDPLGEDEAVGLSDAPFSVYLRRGFLVGIGNVKAIVFYGAFFPQFLDPGASVGPQYATLLASTAAIIFCSMAAYSVAGTALAPVLRGGGVGRRIDALSGALFLSFGVLLGLRD